MENNRIRYGIRVLQDYLRIVTKKYRERFLTIPRGEGHIADV